MKNIADNSHLYRTGNWGSIWKLKVLPKVKNLLWRICQGCLPTRARLLDKGVNCTSLCAMCDESYEDTSHVFFDCLRARIVWQQSLLLSKVISVMQKSSTTAEIIFTLLQELPQGQAEQFATLLWSVWKSRNLRVWENVTDTGQVIVERAKQLLQNWNFANCTKQISGAAGTAVAPHTTAVMTDSAAAVMTDSAATVALPVQCKWLKPHQGRLKCNVDASFSETLNCVGFGLCIRDEYGNFTKAKTLWSIPVCSSDVGEALGLYHAIQWVRELQLSSVDFELDAKKVLDYFNKGGNDISEFGVIMDECRKNCNDCFENSKVEFSRRQANVVAHTLARETISPASPHVFDDVPLCISTLIFNEKL